MEAINIELSGSGRTLGYRSMTQRLLTKHGIVVPRATVAEFQNLLDPEGVANRRQNRLSRRIYQNKGPNFLIHLDGYDKLKRFGFAIHGAICGFSRRMLWLKVTRTNNNPRIIAGYFMEYLAEIKGVPRCIRCDAGTENVLVENIQKSFRWNHADEMAGDHNVLVGSSPSNQRIELWWLSGKQSGPQFWIDFFKDIESRGIFSTANFLQMECLRFSFTKLIQKELDECRQDWNQHRIRSTNNAECPGGKPDMMYFLPDLFGAVDYKTDISHVDIDAVCEWCEFPRANGVQEGFENICTEFMRQHSMNMPDDHISALEVYQFLYQRLQQN